MSTVSKGMTAQELYDDLLSQQIKCGYCKHEILFSQVEEWIEPEGGACNIVCPNCGQGERVDDAIIKGKMMRLTEVDKHIADRILDAAEMGKIEDKQSYKIAMIIKYHLRFRRDILFQHPLSYVDRVAMRLVYDELIAAGTVQPISVYEAKAPVPIDWNKKIKQPVKTTAPTFKGLGGGEAKKPRKKKKGQSTLSFGFSKPKSKEGEG